MATFEELYRLHMPVVLRAAWRAVGRRDVAEEIAADAFLALHRQLDRIDAGQLPAWLITVVRNKATDYWRRQQVEQRHADELVTAPMHDRRDPGLVPQLLDSPSLKPVHRACLLLRYVHGMSRVEIGARLGLSDTQVRGHLQYALTLLRKEVGNAR
jgi:RNA polymerase sigma-70 factor (ECF subfamily)